MSPLNDQTQLVNALQTLPLFSEMKPAQIAALYRAGTLRRAPAGTVLCEPRTTDERLLILLQGELRLESAAGNILTLMHPLRVIGEMGVFTGQPRSSRVVAAEEATLLQLEAQALETLFEADAEFASNMQVSLIRQLYERIHSMNEELQTLREQIDNLKQRAGG